MKKKIREEMTELDFDDPIDWVHEVRRRISEKYGHDLNRLFEAMKEERRNADATGEHFVRLPIARRMVTSV